MSESAMALPLARRIIVDGLLASIEHADALVYRVTPRGFFLAPREPGHVHDYRYEEDSQTFHVFDQFGDPVGIVALDVDEWVAVMRGFNGVPFHFGGARLLLAALDAR